ncbi:hypothetical protein [Mycolicibacterium palauense]|uniref:hypothetical protein n=1 Tax=Mycolicibacterium palauense TaxID=2034511 RepID=UPI000BFF0D8F|nr:hypothetical protein [Mycolicibacterium palauense]
MSNDVEKRWHDPASFRAAVVFVVATVVLAAGAFAVYATHDRYNVFWAVATPAVVFLGALIAFGKALLDWRAGRVWPIWQGAGWFLLALTLLTLAVPAMGLMS